MGRIILLARLHLIYTIFSYSDFGVEIENGIDIR